MGEYVGQDRIPSPDRSESQQVLWRLPISSEHSERQKPRKPSCSTIKMSKRSKPRELLFSIALATEG